MKGEEWEGEKEKEQCTPIVNGVYHNGNERVCVCKINKLEKEWGRERRILFPNVSKCLSFDFDFFFPSF